jgi:transposase
MAKSSDLNADVDQALAEVEGESSASRDRAAVRRVKAISMMLAGLTYEQIAAELKVSVSGAKDIVRRTLARAEQRNVEGMRTLENERLDRAQAAIWAQVLRGDLKAVDSFLKISAQRARLNNLNAPLKVELALKVQQEMHQALNQLENIVKSEVVREELREIEG